MLFLGEGKKFLRSSMAGIRGILPMNFYLIPFVATELLDGFWILSYIIFCLFGVSILLCNAVWLSFKEKPRYPFFSGVLCTVGFQLSAAFVWSGLESVPYFLSDLYFYMMVLASFLFVSWFDLFFPSLISDAGCYLLFFFWYFIWIKPIFCEELSHQIWNMSFRFYTLQHCQRLKRIGSGIITYSVPG